MKPLGRPLSGLKIKMPKMPTAVSATAKPPGSPASPSVGAPPPVKPMNSGQVGIRTPKTKSMPDAGDKPSVFYKSESVPKKTSVQNLRDFLDKKHRNQPIQQSSDQTESPCMSKKTFTPVEAAKAVLAKTHEMLSKSPLVKGEWQKIHNKLEKEGYSKEEADKIDGSIKAKLEKGETGHEKGVSSAVSMGRTSGKNTTPTNKKLQGTSLAGASLKYGTAGAKMSAEANLKDLKSMPKPNLGKSEEVGQPMAGKVKQLQTETENLSTPGHLPQNTEKYASELRGHLKLAKFMGSIEQKRKSKPDNTDLNPNAPKEGKDFGAADRKADGKASEQLEKGETGHEKGVHTALGTKQLKGTSLAGEHTKQAHNLREKGQGPGLSNPEKVSQAREGAAKTIHSNKLAEIKSMPKPKLPG